MRTNSTLGVIAIAAVLTLGMPHTARSAGEETGSFTAKIVGGVTYRPSNVGAVSMEVNMEGTVNSKRLGEGQASWTHYAQADVGAKTGTWRQYGGATFPDGQFVAFQASGTWKEVGSGTWHYRGTGMLSDGTPFVSKFTGDLATRTWAGKTYQ